MLAGRGRNATCKHCVPLAAMCIALLMFYMKWTEQQKRPLLIPISTHNKHVFFPLSLRNFSSQLNSWSKEQLLQILGFPQHNCFYPSRNQHKC